MKLAIQQDVGMNQHPFDNLNPNSMEHSGNGNGDRPLPIQETRSAEPVQDASELELARMRQEDREATTKSMKRLYLVLLAIGLVIGAVVSVGVVSVLNRFELANPPAQDFDSN
jgi:sensor c-di-GMP phosphodiesterase-like protein